MVLDIEDFGLECEQQLGLTVQRHLVLEELKKGCIILLKTNGESSTIMLILGAEFGIVLDQELSQFLLDLNLSLVDDAGHLTSVVDLNWLIVSNVMERCLSLKVCNVGVGTLSQ